MENGKAFSLVGAAAILHALAADVANPGQADVQLPPSVAFTANSTGSVVGNVAVKDAITDEDYRLPPLKGIATLKST